MLFPARGRKTATLTILDPPFVTDWRIVKALATYLQLAGKVKRAQSKRARCHAGRTEPPADTACTQESPLKMADILPSANVPPLARGCKQTTLTILDPPFVTNWRILKALATYLHLAGEVKRAQSKRAHYHARRTEPAADTAYTQESPLKMADILPLHDEPRT